MEAETEGGLVVVPFPVVGLLLLLVIGGVTTRDEAAAGREGVPGRVGDCCAKT